MRRERTGAPDDAEDGASGAVVGGAGAAPFARATADVDLSDDALADPVPIPVGRRVHHADEFVPWYAREPGVSFQDLEVGAADAGKFLSEQERAGLGLGDGVFAHFKALARHYGGASNSGHKCGSLPSPYRWS